MIRSALSLATSTLRAAGSAVLAHLATAYLVHRSRQQAEELRRLMERCPQPQPMPQPVAVVALESTEIH